MSCSIRLYPNCIVARGHGQPSCRGTEVGNVESSHPRDRLWDLHVRSSMSSSFCGLEVFNCKCRLGRVVKTFYSVFGFASPTHSSRPSTDWFGLSTIDLACSNSRLFSQTLCFLQGVGVMIKLVNNFFTF